MSKIKLISLILLFSLAAALSATKVVDKFSEQYTDQALKRALIAFTVARGLNGLISVVQDAEVAMQPAGVGVTVSPGEVLDPVNDLIERFSLVMLASASAIGIQKLLLAISAWNLFNLVLIIFLVGLVGYLLIAHKKKHEPKQWLIKTAIFLLLIRFATPMMALANHSIYQLFLDQDYQQASASLNEITETLEEKDVQTSRDVSILDQAMDWLDNTAQQLDIQAKIAEYKVAAETATKDVIKLITVFLVQTIFFPLLFLWLMIRLCRKAISQPQPRPQPQSQTA